MPLLLLYVGLEIGMTGYQEYIRGLIRGLFWFIPWIVARILFSSAFSPQLSIEDLYGTYTFSQVLLPLVVLILSSLLMKPSTWSDFELTGKIGGFLFLVGLSETFVFPSPGLISRIVYLPLLRAGVVYVTFQWLSYVRDSRLTPEILVTSTGLYGLFLFAHSLVPVLVFQRLPVRSTIFVLLLFGLTVAMHNVRYLVQRTKESFLPTWIAFEQWSRSYIEWYRKVIFGHR